jgi:hypothetical protein
VDLAEAMAVGLLTASDGSRNRGGESDEECARRHGAHSRGRVRSQRSGHAKLENRDENGSDPSKAGRETEGRRRTTASRYIRQFRGSCNEEDHREDEARRDKGDIHEHGSIVNP